MTKIGILGAGQLGRMMAAAALNLGLEPHLYDTDPDSCGFRAGRAHVGSFQDSQGLRRFAREVSVCTYEFENVALEAAAQVSEFCPLRPGLKALEVSQDRLHEKDFFRSLGLATTDYLALQVGDPIPSGGILKTRRLGYDGKGQGQSWSEVGGPALWERKVDFQRELSQVAVRSLSGEIAYYPLVETVQEEGILREVIAPARNLSKGLQTVAQDWTRKILEALDYVGVLALELFVVDDQLLASEMAPRVHNSGHWSDRGCHTSQFENHIRAVMGWPIGPVTTHGCSRLVNLVGSIPALLHPGITLYGKAPRPGRKLGHITLVAPTESEVDRMRQQLWEHV